MADYKLRDPMPVQRGVAVPISRAADSTGYVVLFDADSSDARKQLREVLLPSTQQRSDRLRLFTKLADVQAPAISITPEFSGKVFVLDVFDAEMPGQLILPAIVTKLLRLKHRDPGDDQQPGPVIIYGFPPRRRLSKVGSVVSTMRDELQIRVGELFQRVGLVP